MVAAIESAPESTSALGLVGAALDAAGTRFDEVGEFAARRARIIASSHELQERELIKVASLAASMQRALRARGLGDTGASLAALTATMVMHVAFEQWVNDPDKPPFATFARSALAQLQQIAAAG
jgi:hypothetical protein